MTPKEPQLDRVAVEMGRRLRAAREAAELSQSDLSKLCGKDAPQPTAISNYELGLRRINYDVALLLEEALKKPAAYFLALISEQEAAVIWAMRRETPIDKT